MGQVFAVRQVCEKYLANGKIVFWAFMDLEKAYDTIDRHGMWQMLRVYRVGGKLLKAVQSFYVDSKLKNIVLALEVRQVPNEKRY